MIDTASNSVSATIPVPAYAVGIALTPDGSKAYLPIATGSIAVIDTKTNTIVKSIRTRGSPQWPTVSPNGQTLYVTCQVGNFGGDSVAVIDTSSNTVTKYILVGLLPQGFH